MKNRSEARYSKVELAKLFIKAVKIHKRMPRVTEFKMLGLPEINYYNRAFKNYGHFLRLLQSKGYLKDMKISSEKKNYKLKHNPKRFFAPEEWLKFKSVIKNEKTSFDFDGLLHTGMRISELRKTQIQDINLNKNTLFVAKPKGGRGHERTISISDTFKEILKNKIEKENLKPNDTLGMPSTQYMDKIIKIYLRKAGNSDWNDFSVHNIRKTTEMWLCALNVNAMSIEAHMGHTLDVAMMHYVSTNLMKEGDRQLIRIILGNLLQSGI